MLTEEFNNYNQYSRNYDIEYSIKVFKDNLSEIRKNPSFLRRFHYKTVTEFVDLNLFDKDFLIDASVYMPFLIEEKGHLFKFESKDIKRVNFIKPYSYEFQLIIQAIKPTKEDIVETFGIDIPTIVKSASQTKHILNYLSLDEVYNIESQKIQIRALAAFIENGKIKEVLDSTFSDKEKLKAFNYLGRRTLTENIIDEFYNYFGKQITVKNFCNFYYLICSDFKLYDYIIEKTKSKQMFKYIIENKELYEDENKWFVDKHLKNLGRSQLYGLKRYNKNHYQQHFADAELYVKLLDL